MPIQNPPLQFRTVTIRDALREAVEHFQAGRYDQARGICEQLLNQRPDNADALHLLGVLEIKRKQYAAAVPYFERALAQQEQNAEFHSNFGSLLSELKRFDEAREHLLRAIELKPHSGEARLNLATVLLEKGHYVEAMEQFQQALACNPQLTDAYTGMGCAHSHQLHIPEAIGAFRQAIAANADNVAAHCNLSMMLLCAGMLDAGWKFYEWRIRSKNWGPRTFQPPRWHGEPVRGRTILVATEQGLGDCIQFIRYLPELKQQGAKVVFECRSELKRLLGNHPAINLPIDWPRASDVQGGVDFYVPLLSLPFHFGTTVETIPSYVPYLTADPALAAAWGSRLAAPGLKVGLVWSGNPQNLRDRFRSCRLAELAPLADVENVTFFSLQKGPGSEQAASPPERMTLVNLGEQLTDFADTAAILSHLDLVISVDTSVAHLAGAMGKAVWTLLPYSPDWRWMLVRDDTPWYPTMRLFRQDRPADWSGPIRRMAEALANVRPGVAALRVYQPPTSLEPVQSLYAQGRRDEALRLCRQYLDQQPHHVDALRLAAELLFQDRQITDSIPMFERALALRPGQEVQHFNLGVALMRGGRPDEGIACYRRALAVEPNHVESNFNLANALRDQGRLDEAITYYRQALNVRPQYHKARINLGHLLRRRGSIEEAIGEYKWVLKHHPAYANAYLGLGLCALEQQQPEKALEHMRQAAALEPRSPDVHNHLGTVLQRLKRLPEAQASFEQAITLRPNYVEALGNLAGNWARQGHPEAASECFRRAVAVTPRSPEASCHLACIAGLELGWLEEAVTLIHQGLQDRPEWPQAHHDLGTLLLYQGKLQEGYAEHERAAQASGKPGLQLTQPVWDGSPLHGKTILLYGESGYGDIMQMLRYVPLVAERGGQVVVGCPDKLVRLVSAQPGVLAASERIDALPPFEICASLTKLPRIFATTLATVPADVPYLEVPPDGLTIPPALAGKRLKVGIAWAGDAKDQDPRSCERASFEKLITQHPEIAFYSLQAGSAGLASEGNGHVDAAIDLSPELTDLAAMAAAIAQLDLVISVDGAVVHLAGALAKPVWNLLAFVADARWLTRRDDSPWYPTMRLFRQERHGDWDTVFRQVSEALDLLLAEQKNVTPS